MKKLFNLIYPIAVIVVVLFIWYIASLIIGVELILPTPLVAFENIGKYLGTRTFWVSLGWTYFRCLISFIIAFLVALILSVLSYTYVNIEKFLKPLMAFVRSIPTMSIILILIISISPKNTPLVVAGIVICPTLYQAFLLGFKQIDTKLIEMVNLYKVPKIKQITKFYIPAMLPTILGNSETSFSLNIKLVIASEALAQTTSSIGKLMQYAQINLEIEKLFALTIIAVVISVLSEMLIHFVTRMVCRYDQA